MEYSTNARSTKIGYSNKIYGCNVVPTCIMKYRYIFFANFDINPETTILTTQNNLIF